MSTAEQRWRPLGDESTVGADGRVLSPVPTGDDLLKRYVYRIRLAEHPLCRLVGQSDVLYIGKGAGQRVLGLWRGTHPANIRLERAAYARSRAGQPELRVIVEFVPDEHPDLCEMGLLNEYVQVHGELPPFNGRFEGWMAPRALEAVADRVIARHPELCRDPSYPWPSPPICTGLDLYIGPSVGLSTEWLASLIWVWPSSWQRDTGSVNAEGGPPDLRGHLLLCAPDVSGLPLPRGIEGTGWREGTSILAWCQAAELSGEGFRGGADGVLAKLLTSEMSDAQPLDSLRRLLEGAHTDVAMPEHRPK